MRYRKKQKRQGESIREEMKEKRKKYMSFFVYQIRSIIDFKKCCKSQK